MKRLLAACLLAAPCFAPAQEAPSDFAPIFDGSIGRVFTLDLNALVGEANAGAEVPLRLDAADLEVDATLVEVEGDGVRLPDEQFSLPATPQ